VPEHSHPHYSDDDLFNPETHHEESDVNVRALIWFFVIFVIFAFVTHFALWFLYKAFVKMERRETAPLTEMQRPSDIAVPQNQPLLQPFPRAAEDGEVLPPNRNTPLTDLSDMRAAEEEALKTYGWVDRQKGVVRIPIDVAKQLVVQRGLPVQSGAPQ
jgi:hypothetical protein